MPRPKALTAHPRRDEWEFHRREISRLYIEGVSKVEISNYMKHEHGFDRKPKDYEYRFKKWKLRRNFHENELRSMQDQLWRRQQAGRPSEVVVSGVRWSESVVLGRLNRHKRSLVPSEQLDIHTLPDFLARVQTPSPLMSDFSEWPQELPWLQFNKYFHRDMAATNAVAGHSFQFHGQKALLLNMMRPYTPAGSHENSGPLEIDRIHPPRRMRAVLEVLVPQVHASEHETTAAILHTGLYQSIAVELIRLFIYLETNNMVHQFGTITGCDIDLWDSANVMDFLRCMGFLTKANINCLGRSTDPTSKVFLSRILCHCVEDPNSLDVLGWLIPRHFDVNQSMQMRVDHQWKKVERCDFMQSILMRPKGTCQSNWVEWNCLQASSLTENINAVDLLLNLGADPYDTPGRGPQDYSPLECAASLLHHDRANTITGLLLSKQTKSSSESQKEALEGALQLAIAGANTRLILKLLSERQRLGDGTICSQHFTLAANYADCDTIRLLIDNAPHGGNGSIALPEDILFEVVSDDGRRRLEVVFDKFNYLLDLGADPAVSRCRYGCFRGSLLNSVIRLGTRTREDANVEDPQGCVLKMVQAMRKHGYTLDRPKTTSGGDHRSFSLHEAISGGCSQLVEYLLDWGADIDHNQDDLELQTCECDVNLQWFDAWRSYLEDRSPLHTALNHRRTEIAKMLLRRIPNLKLRGREQRLAMVAGDDTELVTMLLQADSANLNGWKDFLQEAIWARNPKSIELLLSMDTDSRAAVDATTILRAALITGDYNKACQQIAVCDYDSRALLEAVIQSPRSREYQKIVRLLIETRPNTSNDEFEVFAVAHAAIRHDMQLLGALMEALQQESWFARFPTRWDYRQNEDLSGLVPDDHEPAQHILSFASDFDRNNKMELMKTLLEVNIPARGMYTGIHDNLTAETCERLIVAGLEPKPEHLIEAAQRNMLLLVEVLCKSKVSLNTMCFSKGGGYFSRTAVQVAVESGSPEMLQMLLQYGADVEYPAGYYFGATCLQLAAGAGNIGLVRFLLDRGVKVNAQRSLFHGRTAIEIAANKGRLDVLKVLLLQKEHLFRTAAERYQFIRATKMAEQNGHELIAKMLRQHINWDSCDQRLFDEIGDYSDLAFHLDDMTQQVLESEKRHPRYLICLCRISDSAGIHHIFDIDGIEQWIGKLPDGLLDDGTASSEADCSSDGEGNICPENSFATGEQWDAERDELGSNSHQPAELMPVYDDAHHTMVGPERFLRGDAIDEQPGSRSQALPLSAGWEEGATTLAPRAARSANQVPAWLNMQDTGTDNMMQEATYDAAEQVGTWEVLAHRPATENVGEVSGLVLGEVLGEAPLINDMGDAALDHNNAEENGQGEHIQHFDWGFWDKESFEFQSGQLGN